MTDPPPVDTLELSEAQRRTLGRAGGSSAGGYPVPFVLDPTIIWPRRSFVRGLFDRFRRLVTWSR